MFISYYNDRGYASLGRLYHKGIYENNITCPRFRYSNQRAFDPIPQSVSGHSLNIAPICFAGKPVSKDGLNIAYVNYYSDYIPKRVCIEHLHQIDAIITNNEQNFHNFDRAGLKKKILICNTPLNVKYFNNYNKSKNKLQKSSDYTFLSIGSLDTMEGLDILLDAYIQEFNYDDPVLLILRTSVTNNNEPSLNLKHWIDEIIRINNKTQPPRIQIVKSPIADIRDLYDISDAIVSCSRYDCNGFSILEALASQKIIIAPNHSGLHKFSTYLSNFGYRIYSEEVGGRYICDGSHGPFDLVKVTTGGTWYDCDIESVRTQMRKALNENKRIDIVPDLSEFCHLKNTDNIIGFINGL